MRGRKNRLTVCLCVVLIVLSCIVASAAQAYGPGDANGDGRVTSSDARVALRMAAGLYSGSEQERTAADVNYNGSVTSYDARTILCVVARVMDASVLLPPENAPPTTAVTTAAPSGREDSVPWELIMSTTARPTQEHTTEPPRTHPNNYYTRTTLEETTGVTVPEPTTVLPPEEPGTVPDEPFTDEETTAGPVKPTAPSSETTTAAPEPTDPPVRPGFAPQFTISPEKENDTLIFTFAAKNVQSLRRGMLEIDYDPAVLEFVSAEGTEEVGELVNIRPLPHPGAVGCEFIFNEPLLAQNYVFGTVVFRVIDGSASGTSVGIGVQEQNAYNWQTDADYVVLPDRCAYYVLIADAAE